MLTTQLFIDKQLRSNAGVDEIMTLQAVIVFGSSLIFCNFTTHQP